MTTSIAKQHRRRRLRNCSDRRRRLSSIRTLSQYVPLVRLRNLLTYLFPEYFLPWLPLLKHEERLANDIQGKYKKYPRVSSEPFVDLSVVRAYFCIKFHTAVKQYNIHFTTEVC